MAAKQESKQDGVYLIRDYISVLERIVRVEEELKYLHSDNQKIREEMKSTNAQIREEIKQLREEMKSTNAQLREEMRNTNAQLREEINQLREDMNKRFFMLMWFMGAGFSIITAILIAMLARIPV